MTRLSRRTPVLRGGRLLPGGAPRQMLGIALLCGLASAMPIARGQTATERDPIAGEPMRTARLLMRVHLPSNALQLNHAAIEVILNSAAVGQRAAQEVLGANGDIASEYLRFSYHAAGDGEFSFDQRADGTTIVGIATLHAAANVAPTTRRVEDVLRRAAQLLAAALPAPPTPSRDQLEAERTAAKARLDEAAGQIAALQQRMAEIVTSLPVGLDNLSRIQNRIEQAEQQIAELHLRAAGHEARRRAIAEQVARLQAEVDRVVAQDEALREMLRVVDFREQKLARLRALAEKGAASETDVLSAEEQVALSRAELARQRLETAQSTGGGMLAKLNDELVTLALHATETAAQIERLEEDMKRGAEAKRRAEQLLMECQQPLAGLQQQREALSQQIHELELRIREGQRRPIVDIVGDPPATAPSADGPRP